MSVAVLTAVADPRWEADLVAGLAAEPGVHVVRRCVDLADLLAAASAGLARAVLLSADLRRLDRDALTRLAVAGVGVVGLVPPQDEAATRRLRQLGVATVVEAGAPAEQVAAALLASIGSGGGRPSGGAAGPVAGPLGAPVGYDYADPAAVLAPAPLGIGPDPTPGPSGPGRVVAVWGPHGAPGRTTVAVSVAAELAELGHPTLLVDADVYGGVVAQLLGLLDEAPGLAAACRLANHGTLDLAALDELALEVRPRLRVLTGIARAHRWPELRPSGLDVVLGLARHLARYVVVDCAFCLERDEELSYDTLAPRRNGATLAALDVADEVVAVASADPVGLQRFVRALGDLREVLPAAEPLTVVNRLRASAVAGGDAEREIAVALARYAGVGTVRFVPDDKAVDRAVAVGRVLAEAAPGSPARAALRAVAMAVAGSPPPRRRGTPGLRSRRSPGRRRPVPATRADLG